MPDSCSADATFGKRVGSMSRMSRWTAGRGAPATGCVRSWSWIASATSSRGASSSTKRSPSPFNSRAPSPRIASVMRNPSRPSADTSAVGWNCWNSMSASAAPAASASVIPAPMTPGGFVVRDQSAAAPPVARMVARARTSKSRLSGPITCTPMQRPSRTASDTAELSSSTRTFSWSAASADRSRVMRRPVALPPACTTRRREWPPSSPSASAPWRSASKWTPRCSRWRTRSGESSHSTRAADSRDSARPAFRVSRRCSSTESSSASAAAIPPWAQ